MLHSTTFQNSLNKLLELFSLLEQWFSPLHSVNVLTSIFWAWFNAKRARCPCCHPTTSMSLQGGSSLRPNKRMSSSGLHALIEVSLKQGHGQDMVAPGGASCRLPISHPLHGGIRRCDTRGGKNRPLWRLSTSQEPQGGSDQNANRRGYQLFPQKNHNSFPAFSRQPHFIFTERSTSVEGLLIFLCLFWLCFSLCSFVSGKVINDHVSFNISAVNWTTLPFMLLCFGSCRTKKKNLVTLKPKAHEKTELSENICLMIPSILII